MQWSILFLIPNLITAQCLNSFLPMFNFRPITPDPGLIPTFCTNLYINGQNCIDLLVLNDTFNNSSANFTNAGLRAAKMGEIFYMLLNNTAALNNGTLKSQGIDEPYIATSNSGSGSFQTASILKNITSTHFDGINRCLRDYYIITNGLWCMFTSNVTKNYTNTSDPYAPLSFHVDLNRTGGPLSNCLPLIDSYCILSYGISISFLDLPLGSIFSMGDGTINASLCYALQNVYNSTDQNDINYVYGLLINQTVFTNLIPFIPTDLYLNAYTRFINGTFTGNWNDMIQNNSLILSNRNIGLASYSAGSGELVTVDGWVAIPVPMTTFYSNAIERWTALNLLIVIFGHLILIN